VNPPERVPRVFVTYSHDSPEHADRVLTLADGLRAEGIDCHLDQYDSCPYSVEDGYLRCGGL
jgi:hypothetical protein